MPRVKGRKTKKHYKNYLTKYAVKIKCCYCDLYNNCRWREGKEFCEKKGIITKCTVTPNRSIKVLTFKQYLHNHAGNSFIKDDERYVNYKNYDRFTGH